MYGIFMESLVIFKLYTGLKLLLALTGISLIYLLIREKNRTHRILFVYAPILILVLFLFPVSRKLFVAAGLDGETYYRILWTIPMGIITAYGAMHFLGSLCKHNDAETVDSTAEERSGVAQESSRKLQSFRNTLRSNGARYIGLICAAILIICSGSLVYKSDYITKAENLYHIPDTVIKICERIHPDDADAHVQVTAVFPEELVHYIRQYDSFIRMPYGREMIASQWDYYNAVHEAMEEDEILDFEKLVSACREEYCQYIILSKTRQTTGSAEDAGLTLLDEIDGYLIYLDPVSQAAAESFAQYYEDED